MSIKKLFGSDEAYRNYLSNKSQKDAFTDVESSRNAEQIKIRQDHYFPQIDYADPQTFARYGSARLYYKSAMNRILDYYPYDGSDAEINEFYNQCLDIEKYILDNKYPRTNGYITLCKDGCELNPSIGKSKGYGVPLSAEYIDFKGGPGTGSLNDGSLKNLASNPHNDKFQNSNIYDDSIYQTEGLPSDYGKGTRTSNLLANFDDGVTVEFWLKTGSAAGLRDGTLTDKQVVFDWWNSGSSGDEGRILIELTGTVDGSSRNNQPFVLTIQSGSHTKRDFISLGSSSIHANAGSWHHYAISVINSGSSLVTNLYVDGVHADKAIKGAYNLSASDGGRSWPYATEGSYSSSAGLQGWWRLDSDVSDGAADSTPDSSGHGRHGTGSTPPTVSNETPSEYIALKSNTFDATNDFVSIESAAVWNQIVGNGGPGTSKMTISAWVRKTGDGEDNKGRIIDLGQDTALLTTPAEKIEFSTTWNSALLIWKTDDTGLLPDPSSPGWAHVVVTYDASNSSNDPKIYVNGVEKAVSLDSGTRTGAWEGVTDYGLFIGNRNDNDRTWQGELCDVAIWNSILSATEIESMYYAHGIVNTTHNVDELNSKNVAGRIGGLLTAIDGSGSHGAGRLSGSLDEFRYWKTARTGQDIGRNWFTQIRGGVNTDIANTTLGLYYKFNEGITTDANIDKTILDYAGRVTNGTWTGYASGARNTGSAILEASASVKEYLDPIIYSVHPDVVTLSNGLAESGSYHDYNNNSSFMSLVPGWILDQDAQNVDSDLKYISHIAGAYFDKLYIQMSEIPKLRHRVYPSSSHKPISFAKHLPQSLGLAMPELFIDSTVLERFSSRDEKSLFEEDIHDTKNLIYTNLYNNLANIYKSKGTEKAVRNILRCFNIDDKVLRLAVNSNNSDYVLRNNLQQNVLQKNTLNFNISPNTNAVVYQAKDSTNAESAGYISGSTSSFEDPFGLTVEANVLFPYYSKKNRKLLRESAYNTVSLFGMTTVNTRSSDSEDGADLTFVSDSHNNSNFNVYAVRDAIGSKNVRFKLTSSLPGGLGFNLTSSIYSDVYNNEMWNFSLRVKPKKFPYGGFPDTVISGTSGDEYDVIFSGFNVQSADIKKHFTASTTISNTLGKNFLNAGKRLFVGAERDNIIGTVIYRTDVLFSSLKYWAKYLQPDTILQHATDLENIGISGSYQSMSPFASTSEDLLNKDTLALNWNFENVTGSDSTGKFIVQDFSSGSSDIRNNHGSLGNIVGFQHSGIGYGFEASSTDVIDKRSVNTYRFINPEQAVSSDMIQLFSEEDVLFPNMRREEILPNFVYSIEKSMYNAISEEMLDFFAGAIDFHNLIGEPVNRYRDRYKSMEKLREAFFRRVNNVTAVEKYIEYYKWFDDAITSIISQLVPASAEFTNNVMDVVESHVLERNKYQSKMPIIDSNTQEVEPDGALAGLIEQSYNWFRGSSPPPTSPRNTKTRKEYWRRRAETTAAEISSGDANIDAQRQTFKDVIFSSPRLSGSAPIVSTVGGTKYIPGDYARRNFAKYVDLIIENPYANRTIEEDSVLGTTQTIRGGINFEPQKSFDFTSVALLPAGPVNVSGGIFVPQNVLLGLTDDMVRTQEDEIKNPDLPKNKIRKIKKVFKVQHGRDWEDGIGYKNVKSTMAFPFNVVSSTVDSGFNKLVTERVSGNIEITNLHSDAYGQHQEIPLQGPFTRAVVGGHQSRHIAVNTGSDNNKTRPEAWRIVLGTRSGFNPSGAIGMVGPDYPPPSASGSGSAVYPYRPYQKAYLYRDYIAKRPVNIKNINMLDSASNTTVPGNYLNQYEIIHTVGAYTNPRAFIDNQPTLPSQLSQVKHTTNVRTILDVHRGAESHFEFVGDYSTSYLTGTVNKTVITNRFRAPGGIEIQSRGYQDFKASEFSPYNCLSYRNLSVIKPSQGPSGTISEATGGTPSTMRVYDIHGKDYGLRSHLARHTARFGRDSLFVSGTATVNNYGPGASYDQLPGFHKIHRNNQERVKIASETLVPVLSGCALTNVSGVSWPSTDIAPKGTGFLITGSTYKDKFLYDGQNGPSVFTLAAWVNPNYMRANSSNPNTANTIFSLGYVGSIPGIHVFLQGQATVDQSSPGIAGSTYVHVNIRTTDGVGNYTTAKFQQLSASVITASWNHIVVVYSASAWNSISSVTPTIYVNGITGSDGEDNPTQTTVSPLAQLGEMDSTYNNFRNNTSLDVEGVVLVGTYPTPGTYEFTGSMDEVAFFSGAISAAEVSNIYNSGVPCDLTCSTYTAAEVVGWYRMGDGAGDSGSIGTSDIFTYRVKNQVEDDNHMMAVVHDSGSVGAGNAPTSLSYTAGMAGCVASTVGYSSSYTYDSASMIYDNFYIQNQIPRSERQYRWINKSLEDPSLLRYRGFQNTFDTERMPYLSTSAGYVSFYDFVSASNPITGTALAGGYQPVNRLNILTVDPITDSTDKNTLGFPSTTAVSNYLNDTLNPNISTRIAPASYLNLLLTRRQSIYGWGWTKFRNKCDHPIILKEKRENVLRCITGSDNKIREFRMPPLSMKGRPALINVDIPVKSLFKKMANPNNNLTLKVGNTNYSTFFNDLKFNNLANIDLRKMHSPLKDVLKASKRSNTRINWLLYTQNVFPSLRNEFKSGTVKRANYDNMFWRDIFDDRTTLGREIANSFGLTETEAIPYGGKLISQSCWALDAPRDFLTRSVVPVGAGGVIQTYNRNDNPAGELQNTYFAYKTVWAGGNTQADRMNPGALYARKHFNPSPNSVAPAFAPQPTNLSRRDRSEEYLSAAFSIEMLGGEAEWLAPTQAGINVKGAGFAVSQSQPWYNNHDKFNEDLKLMAKGFSIVPEYRISEHVEDYVRFGLKNKNKLDTFAIPGTSASIAGESPLGLPPPLNSSQKDFYKDYSNSDFLEMLGVSVDQMLRADQIRLSCTAAIKYNPYRGFYPAQATLDLVSQFSRSFTPNITIAGFGGNTVTYGYNTYVTYGGWLKPLFDPVFSPGILYNTMKAGLAVDYPVVTDATKILRTAFGPESDVTSGPSKYKSDCGHWALAITGCVATAGPRGYFGGQFWDKRLPFETIIDPAKHMGNLGIVDQESHPSASFAVTGGQGGIPAANFMTATLDGAAFDEIYKLRAKNFFGAVPKFFLKDDGLTKLESKVVPDDLRFPSGSVYMGRIWIEPSHNGKLYYHQDFDSNGAQDGFYGRGGAKQLTTGGTTGKNTWRPEQFPIGSSSQSALDKFKQTFTMYNRISAFGPDVAGRPYGPSASTDIYNKAGKDSFSGYNGAFTPPYFDGMARVDLVFRPTMPSANAKISDSYSLEQILAECQLSYRRIDSGYKLPSGSNPAPDQPALIPVWAVASASAHDGGGGASPSGDKTIPTIYDGYRIDVNSMQISSSFNLFGIERVLEQTQDKFGQPQSTTNKTVGKRWIIQPKFETPMFDFTEASASQPVYAETSTPVGMWHQFGKIPTDPSKGIKFGISDIPPDWLKYHYEITNVPSIYNNYDTSSLETNAKIHRTVKSLADLLGFDQENSTKKLGQLKEKQTIHEAVIAIPYISDEVNFEELAAQSRSSTLRFERKKFIEIPKGRVKAALKENLGSKASNSKRMAGDQIRNLERLVREKYVFPPQFDFVRNENINAVAMYVFEFKYEFDQDDLSYIWQNLAPRDYKKVSFQNQSVAHNLRANQFITNKILKNPNLRWMVFKVKQRGLHDYYDLVADQLDGTTTQIFDNQKKKKGFEIGFNWPYDYLSFVELIKLDVDVLYKPRSG